MRLNHAEVVASVCRYMAPGSTHENEMQMKRLARFGAYCALILAGEPEWDADTLAALSDTGTWDEVLGTDQEGRVRLAHGMRNFLERWMGTHNVADIVDYLGAGEPDGPERDEVGG